MRNIIEFKTEKEISEFYNPKEDEIEKIEVEIRYDPLTKKTSHIIQKPFPIAKDPDMRDVKKKSFCPMCPENIDKVGARDTKILDKRLSKKGDAVLMANITPYAKYSLVCRLTEGHYLSLDEFEAKHFSNALELLVGYLNEVKKKDDDVNFASIIMNYLKPAGSSIVHPHLQMLISQYPNDYQKRIYEKGKKFYRKEGKSYWDVLVRKDKKRYIGKTGQLSWLTAFSPQGFEHVKGITMKNLLEFKKDDIREISNGIINILRGYHNLNYNSFNISIFIPPLNNSEGFATLINMITRSNLDKFYWCDVSSISKLQDEPLTNKKPEDVATYFQEFF